MTKREFVEFIHSFGKQPGEFTKDEIVEIGIEHRGLAAADKSWMFVKQMVGWEGSPDSLRVFVRNRMLKEEAEEEAFSESSEEPKEDPRNTYLERLYIEKTKVRDSYNAYRRDLRDEARIEDLKASIVEAASKFSKLPTLTFGERIEGYEGSEAILCLSDLHIGVDCDNAYNKYNVTIAGKRLSKLIEETIKECEIHKVDTLHVINLGDMIHGCIHTNARLEQQLDVAEQVMVAGEFLSESLNRLQVAAPKIKYYSVLDNHSRAIANKNEAIEKEQFSRVIDWFIKERLKDTDIEFCSNEIDLGVGKIRLENGKLVVFAHGHQDNVNSSWNNFVGMTQEWVDYIILAHYHSPKEKSYNGSVVFVNGSIVGTEQYAFGRRLFSKPSQKLLVFKKNSSTYSDITIGLE